MGFKTITWNPNDKTGTSITLSNGDLTVTTVSGSTGIRATDGKKSGKWYWEVKLDSGSKALYMGVSDKAFDLASAIGNNKFLYGNSATYAIGNVIGMALDLDLKKITFYKNGVLDNTQDLFIADEYFPHIRTGTATTIVSTANFGSTAFAYPAPTGFKPYNIYPYNKFLILSNNENLSVQPFTYALDVVPTMSSNANSNVVVSASSVNSTNYEPFKAFNNTVVGTSDRWMTPSGKTIGEWIKVDLGEKKKVGKYVITAEDSTAYTPQGFNLEGSNNDVDWELLDNRAGLGTWTQKQVREFMNNVKVDYYRYYRITATEANSTLYVSFGEIELIEVIDASSKYIPSSTEQNFINHGMDKSIELDLSAEISKKSFVKQTPTALGSGKVFTKTIDTTQLPIKKIEIK